MSFTLSPTSYTATSPDEVVAITLSIIEEGYVNYHQGIGINVDGVDYYLADYDNLTGADPWIIPLVYPDMPDNIHSTAGTHQIYVKSYTNGVADGLITSNTISITIPSDGGGGGGGGGPDGVVNYWWIAIVALVGIGLAYYLYKRY